MAYRDKERLRFWQKVEAFRKEQTAEETIEKECEQSIYDPVVYIMKIPAEFRERMLTGNYDTNGHVVPVAQYYENL